MPSIPGVLAGGTNLATATPLQPEGQIFSIDIQAVSSGGGVVMPYYATPFVVCLLRNSDASNACLVYPLPGGTINGVTTPFTLASAGTVVQLWSLTAKDWVVFSGGNSGGSGSVTSFGFTNGGGFTGSVTNPTTTPALALGTNVTGLLKGASSALAAAGGSDIPQTGLVIKQNTIPTTTDAPASGTVTMDFAVGNRHATTLTGTTTLALGPGSPAVDQWFTVILIQDGTGSRTVNWFSGITWQGGGAPTLQTAPGSIDVFMFWCKSSGVYIGFNTTQVLAGSAGQALYNNAGSIGGAAGLKIGTSGQANLPALTVASPANFDIFTPSSNRGGPWVQGPQGFGPLPRNIFKCGACTAVTAATIASLLGSPAGVLNGQSLTIPANTLAAGNRLRFTLTAKYTSIGTTNTGILQFSLGGSTVLTNTVAGGLVFTVAQSTAMPIMTQWGYIDILSIGASATCSGAFGAQVANPGGSTLALQCFTGSTSFSATSTFDSTANAAFDAKWTWSTTGMSIQVLAFELELLN